MAAASGVTMRDIRKRAITITVLSAAVSLILAVRAGAVPANPCSADAQKLCPNVATGGGHMLQCLHAHQSELSPECAKSMAQMKERAAAHIGDMREMKRACGGDVDKFCKGVQLGGGRLLGCLKKHQSDLSPACQAMFKSRASH